MSQLKSGADIKADSDPSAGVFAKIGIAVLLLSYGINAMDRALFPMMLTDVRREYVFAFARHHFTRVPYLDVNDHPDGQARSRRQRQARALGDGGIGNAFYREHVEHL